MNEIEHGKSLDGLVKKGYVTKIWSGKGWIYGLTEKGLKKACEDKSQ